MWSNNCLVALTKSTHHAKPSNYQSVLYYTIWAQAKWKRNGQFSKRLHVVGSRVESLPRQPLYAWFVIAQLFFVSSESHLLWFSTLSLNALNWKNVKNPQSIALHLWAPDVSSNIQSGDHAKTLIKQVHARVTKDSFIKHLHINCLGEN